MNRLDRGRRSRWPDPDLDGPLDPDLPLHLLVVMALCTEAERLVPDLTATRTRTRMGTGTGTGPDGAPPP